MISKITVWVFLSITFLISSLSRAQSAITISGPILEEISQFYFKSFQQKENKVRLSKFLPSHSGADFQWSRENNTLNLIHSSKNKILKIEPVGIQVSSSKSLFFEIEGIVFNINGKETIISSKTVKKNKRFSSTLFEFPFITLNYSWGADLNINLGMGSWGELFLLEHWQSVGKVATNSIVNKYLLPNKLKDAADFFKDLTPDERKTIDPFIQGFVKTCKKLNQAATKYCSGNADPKDLKEIKDLYAITDTSNPRRAEINRTDNLQVQKLENSATGSVLSGSGLNVKTYKKAFMEYLKNLDNEQVGQGDPESYYYLAITTKKQNTGLSSLLKKVGVNIQCNQGSTGREIESKVNGCLEKQCRNLGCFGNNTGMLTDLGGK